MIPYRLSHLYPDFAFATAPRLRQHGAIAIFCALRQILLRRTKSAFECCVMKFTGIQELEQH
jgi:hypothetical protein